MIWETRTTSIAKLTGLALGLCLVAPTAQMASASPMLDSSVTTPSSTTVRAQGLKTAVVAATDTGGDVDVALRALKAANIALGRSSGYIVVPPNEVAKSLQDAGTRWPFEPRQYPDVRKKLKKADRVMAVTVSPGDGTDATYSAVVELFDLNTGGLVGRGESTFTASPDSMSLVDDDRTSTALEYQEPLLGSFQVPEGTAGAAPDTTVTVADATVTTTTVGSDARFLAVDGAILRAVAQMNEPAEVSGIIVSLPGGYLTRLSKGQMHGLRNGARLEYTVGGRTIAYGSIIDVGKGEAMATVAPERAFPLLSINGEFRTVSNPPVGAAGKTREEIDNAEWKKFERDFGIGAAIAGVAYLLFIR